MFGDEASRGQIEDETSIELFVEGEVEVLQSFLGNRNFKGYFWGIGKVPERSQDVNHADQRSEDGGAACEKGLPAPCAQDIHNYCDTV